MPVVEKSKLKVADRVTFVNASRVEIGTILKIREGIAYVRADNPRIVRLVERPLDELESFG